MTLNPSSEAKYGFRLAIGHLERAERLFSMKDWPGTVSASQLAVESFAKAVISMFEVPTWSHDPSNQLNGLIGRLPHDTEAAARQLADLASEMAPEHGRSSYGEPTAGLLPGDIYEETHAQASVAKARTASAIAQKLLARLDANL